MKHLNILIITVTVITNFYSQIPAMELESYLYEIKQNPAIKINPDQLTNEIEYIIDHRMPLLEELKERFDCTNDSQKKVEIAYKIKEVLAKIPSTAYDNCIEIEAKKLIEEEKIFYASSKKKFEFETTIKEFLTPKGIIFIGFTSAYIIAIACGIHYGLNFIFS